ncbi:hypothetical protein EI94DRAFT_1249523 [Lactarius quietus]|nr:hypothetical protein EI94DRAFT_1249523 [Lactarius quietus]
MPPSLVVRSTYAMNATTHGMHSDLIWRPEEDGSTTKQWPTREYCKLLLGYSEKTRIKLYPEVLSRAAIATHMKHYGISLATAVPRPTLSPDRGIDRASFYILSLSSVSFRWCPYGVSMNDNVDIGKAGSSKMLVDGRLRSLPSCPRKNHRQLACSVSAHRDITLAAQMVAMLCERVLWYRVDVTCARGDQKKISPRISPFFFFLLFFF